MGRVHIVDSDVSHNKGNGIKHKSLDGHFPVLDSQRTFCRRNIIGGVQTFPQEIIGIPDWETDGPCELVGLPVVPGDIFDNLVYSLATVPDDIFDDLVYSLSLAKVCLKGRNQEINHKSKVIRPTHNNISLTLPKGTSSYGLISQKQIINMPNNVQHIVTWTKYNCE